MTPALTTDTQITMTVEEFLDWPGGGSGHKFQLIDGVPRAMAPPSMDHGVMQLNIGASINSHKNEGGWGTRPPTSSGAGPGREANFAACAAAFAFVMLAATAAAAVEPGERLADPALEARARALSAQLRCLVCQNQSIDDSNAPLAKDLRLVVRERLNKGESDEAVMSYVVGRYGEFVLLKPPFKISTLLLWLAPLLCLAGIGYALLRASGIVGVSGGSTVASRPVGPLSPEEERRLAKLLAEKD